ncbi:MAG: hypothetical protein DRP46_05230 [Candidatus Zixiibacteriota bacterium]|nr:MAG: hypothetical protein DRP46_05230 [candidate division Zixibacteria bacterium]
MTVGSRLPGGNIYKGGSRMDNLQTAYDGICSNCKSISDCAYRHNPGAAITYCEEFECAGRPGAEKKQTPVDFDKYIIETIDTSNGLCCNCDHKSDCLNNRNPGNVLYCEEYACH